MTGSWATLAFLIFGFIILAYLLLQIYDRLRNDAHRPAQAAHPPQLRAGVDELIRELRQAAEQINADMTVRANTLQKLVDDANQALKRLDAAAQRASLTSAAPRRSGATRQRPVAAMAAPAPAVQRTPPPDGAKPPNPQATRRTAPPRPPPISRDEPWPGAPAGARRVQMPPVAAASPAAASAYRQQSVDVDLTDTGHFQTVRRLADQGLSAAEIARSIGLGREEVELIVRVSGEGAS